MKKNFLAMVAVGLLAGPMVAHAELIVSAGESVLWNFDLSGAPTLPLNGDSTFSAGISGFNAGEDGTWTLFADLNGGGSVFATSFVVPGTIHGTLAGWTDGTFSAQLTMTVGSVSANPFFLGRNAAGGIAPFLGTPVVTSVPEPGTLALFGLGLAALGLAMRRRKASLFA